MYLTERFKILPVLILVAFLAFSVRLTEVASGVSSLSGAALAVEEVNAEPPPLEPGDHAESPDHAPIQMAANNSPEKSGDKKPEEDPLQIIDDGTMPDWQDASDFELNNSPVKMEVFKDLSDRRKELEAREKRLMTREALLKAAEQELDRKYQELTQLRGEIEKLLGQQSEEEEKRMQSLVKIYEGMKPKDAARIFDTLDLDILVGVTSTMSERRLSPIMAKMNPERARTITIMLAEQKKLPSLPQN